MHRYHVPTLDLRYWAALCLASIFGANMGDYVARDLHLGHVAGLPYLAAGLAVVLIVERFDCLQHEVYYWLAINGASCAASTMPIPATAKIKVTPRPEQLIGFSTREEQMKVQKMCLEAPMNEVKRLWATLPPRIRSGEG